jgi:hypothetical protein
VNPAAKGFAAVFVLQAVLFLATAVTRHDLQFRLGSDLRSSLALLLILYAMVIYEALGWLAGHGLMQGPLFGVAPCPTTIFTIGLLLLARGGLAVWLSIIPVIWALIGSTAAVLLGVTEDIALAVAALLLLVYLAVRPARGVGPGRVMSADRPHGR